MVGSGPSSLWRESRWTLLAQCALAVAGAVLAFEAWGRGHLLYRLPAFAVGGLLLLPLLLTAIAGRRWIRVFQRLALVVLGIGLCIGALELVVRLTRPARFVPPVEQDDPILGYVFEPGTGGADAWGFRNAEVPERVDIFCTGDSQTWGTNIKREETWPRALARRTGRSTYNAGISGYGALQYLALLERAQALDARIVVIGLFFGNDLFDAFRFARLEHWSDFRDPALDYPPLVYGVTPGPAPNLVMGAVDGLMEHSLVLGRLGFELKLAMRNHPALADLYWVDGGAPRLAEGPVRTYFTPDYRLRALNLDDHTIRDGMRITLEAYARAAERSTELGMRLAVLLIHTKEYSYWRYLEQRDPALADRLAELGRAEAEVTERLGDHFASLDLRVVEPTPEIVAALAAGRALWPAYTDGHLNEEGTDLIAAVLQLELADWIAALPPR